MSKSWHWQVKKRNTSSVDFSNRGNPASSFHDVLGCIPRLTTGVPYSLGGAYTSGKKWKKIFWEVQVDKDVSDGFAALYRSALFSCSIYSFGVITTSWWQPSRQTLHYFTGFDMLQAITTESLGLNLSGSSLAWCKAPSSLQDRVRWSSNQKINENAGN